MQTTQDDDDGESRLQIDEGAAEPDSDYEKPSKKKKRGKKDRKREEARADAEAVSTHAQRLINLINTSHRSVLAIIPAFTARAI